MMRSLSSGVSGLKSHQIKMDVIGNNIANVNTAGFKRSRVNFQEMMVQTMQGATAPHGGMGGTNPMQVGLGTNIGSIDSIFTQGSMQSTGKVTDLAIQGEGFFVLSDGTDLFYSRAGNFDLDRDGNMIDKGTGLKVMGWTADLSGNVNTSVSVGSINVPIGRSYPPTASTSISFGGNLNANAAVGTQHQTTMDIYDSLGNVHRVMTTFEPTGVSGEWMYTVSLDASDALIQSYLATYYPNFSTLSQSSQDAILTQASEVFLSGYASATGVGRLTGPGVHIESKTHGAAGNNDQIILTAGAGWNTTVTPNALGGNDINVTFPAGATLSDLVTQLTNVANPAYPLVDAFLDTSATGTNPLESETVKLGNGSDSKQTGIVVFTSSGQVDEAATQIANSAMPPNLTNPFIFQPTGANAVEVLPDITELTQYTSGFTALAKRQNGNPSGTLTNITIGKDGSVSGVFSNGFTLNLGAIALANFNNPAGMLRMGNNLYKESTNSGSKMIGTAENGGRGSIMSGNLEMSNVDLAQEFTDMIVTQRGFQANTRVITTSDEMLQELANIKR